MTPPGGSDSEHVDYVVKPTTLDGWAVYGVRANGWHDRVRANLTETEAVEVGRQLEEELAP